MTTVYKGNKANLYISSADKFIEMYSVTQSCELLNYVLLKAWSGCCSFTFELITGKVFFFTLLHILNIFPGQFGTVLHSLKWQTLNCLAALSLNSDTLGDRNKYKSLTFCLSWMEWCHASEHNISHETGNDHSWVTDACMMISVVSRPPTTHQFSA